MNVENNKVEQARNLLVQMALDEICSEEIFSDFDRHAYYVIAKMGLQLKAKEEQLFTGKEWSNPRSKDYLIKKLKIFSLIYLVNSSVKLSLPILFAYSINGETSPRPGIIPFILIVTLGGSSCL